MNLDTLNTVPRVLFLDFDGVFTDNNVYIDSVGNEILKFSKYDSYGVSMLKNIGIKSHVISSDSNGKIIEQRCNKMHISFSFNIKDKLTEAKRICTLTNDSLKDCAFVGNDLNDLGILDAVGYPIVVNDAHPALINRGYIKTKCDGGNGAIREIADKIMDIFEAQL